MRAAILTREFPPDVYGGAGVHVDFLVRELRRLIDVDVHCMGEPRDGRHRAHREGGPARRRERRAPGALHRPGDDRRGRRLGTSTSCTRTPGTPTWPATGPSCSTTSRTSSPRTASSRNGRGRPSSSAAATGSARGPSARRTRRPTPWSRSATACAPTSSRRTRRSTRAKLHVVYNGIDTDFYRPDPDTSVLERIGVDLTRPYVAFVGRITRQKGVPHLLRAGLALRPRPAGRAARRRRRHPRAEGRDRRA